MATNLATYAIGTTRAGEVTAADWAGGMNKGASNAPSVGTNTGDYNPKEQDWPRIEDTVAHQSGIIGAAAVDVNTVNGADVNNEVAFVAADASTAPDAVLDATTGAVNRTGQTVPSGAYVWGEIPVA